MLWGLFEQKSSFLTPLLFLFQGLPEELRRRAERISDRVSGRSRSRMFLEIQLFLLR